MSAGRLDKSLRLERRASAARFDQAGAKGWDLVAIVRAELVDQLPGRSEQTEAPMPVATRRARIRIRYRAGVEPSMRFTLGDRVMKIVSGPVEIGRRRWLDFIVEDHKPAGGAT